MPNWKKVIVSGSNAHLNNITASGHFSALDNGFTVNNHSSTELFVDGDIIATGDVIGQQYIVSSSVTHMTQSFSSGSTIFGDTLNDTHLFTGSLFITGITFDDTPVSDAVVVIDTSSGRLYYTGSYGGSGGSGTGFPYAGSDSLTADPPIAVITGSLLVSGSGHISASNGDVIAKNFITNNALGFNDQALTLSNGGIELNNNSNIAIAFSNDGLEFKADSGDKFSFNKSDLNNADFEIFGEDNNATFYVDASNNNVGINTTSPFQGNKLDVNGGVRVDNITASNDISGSGALFASLSFNEFDVAEANLRTVVYAPSNHSQAGKLFFTSAFSEGGGGGGGDMSNFKVTSDDGGGSITVTNNNTVDFEGGSNITTSHNTSTKTVTIDLDDRITVTDVTASNISLADSIVHTGDTNTKVRFTDDTITFTAGGNTNTTLTSTQTTFTQDVIGSEQGLFLNDDTYNWGNNVGVSSRSGFRVVSNKSYSHLTPQTWNSRWAMIGMPLISDGTKFRTFPHNYVVYGNKDGLSMFVNPGNDVGPEDDFPGPVKPDVGGGGNPGVISGDFENVDTTGKKIGVPTIQVRGGDLELIPSGATDGGNTAGIRIASGDVSGSFDPGIFFYNRDNKTNVSGSFFYQSASAEIRFDSASNSIKFLAGNTNDSLQPVLHISKSGNSPRVGIGTSDPKSTFDFKQVEDTSTGTELLLRTARTTATGALDDDEGGSINFVIDSGSFNNIKTSGSLAKIKTKVNSVGATGVQGKLIFELSKGARDSNDVFSFGFAQPGGTLGDFGLYSQIQTASLLLRDFSSVGNSVIEMRDSSNNFKLQIGRGNITASGGISASGTITANSFVGTLTGTATGLAGTPDITVGSIEATSLNVTSITSSIVTSSIIQTEGSNIFGDTNTDTQTFNGHITASGNISASGRIITNVVENLNVLTLGDIDGNAGGVRLTINQNGHFDLLNATDTQITGETILLANSANDNVGSNIKILGHITASGDISASGTITAATLDAAAVSDTLAAAIVAEIDNDEIPIAKLAEDAVTVTAGTGLSGGGSVTLGSSITINSDGLLSSSAQIASDISGSFTAASASLAADIVTNAGNIGTTTNALTVDNATLQLNSGTTFNGSAARTISIKDGGVDSDALAANILVTQLTSSIISASSTVTANSFTGKGLSIDGSSNSHIEVGEYNVGFDTVGANTLFITGSGLIVSGAMADQNHHNMVKIGNVELLDVSTLLSQNEFLIHNVSSLKITSGSDGGDIAGTAGRLLEHNGTDFTLYRNNSSAINSAADGTLTFNGSNISFVATGDTFMKAPNSSPGAASHIVFSTSDPNTVPGELNSVNFDSAFPFLGGAVTASAVSASSLITDTLSGLSDLTVDVEGDITLDANGADVILKDDGTEFGRFKRDSSDFVIKSATNNKDIIFKGVDDSSTITALTLDMSDAGKAIFNDGIVQSNNKFLAGTETGGTTRNILGINSSDVTQVANANIATNIKGTSITLASPVTASIISASGDLFFRSRTIAMPPTNGYNGDVVSFGNGPSGNDGNINAGELYYLSQSNTDLHWELTDADAAGTATNMLGIAVADNTPTFLVKGIIQNSVYGGFTTGAPLYVSTTAGDITGTAPSGNGDIVRVVGYSVNGGSRIIYFNPSNDHIVHA